MKRRLSLSVPVQATGVGEVPMDEPTSDYYAPNWLASLTIRLRRASSFRPLVYSVFSVLYLIPTIWLCQSKLFWDDEFFTLYLSRATSWKSLLQALGTGADQHPPPFYYLTHWITQLLGTSHVTVRLPAIVGFWILCICLYEIGRSLVTPMWGVVAMILPLSTGIYYYATEARGYGLVTGFAALAVLSWLKVTENKRRKIFLPLLGFSLIGAVCSHYYAGLILISLAAGEAVRSKSMRKIDFPVWASLGCAVLPVFVFFSTIRSARGYSTHFWAHPIWSHAILFYSDEMGLGLAPLLGLLVAGIAFGFSMTGWKSPTGDDPHRGKPLTSWQSTTLYCLSATPLIAMILAKFVTHAFSPRYAISAVVGITILVVYLISRVSPRSLTALVATVSCLLMFGVQVRLLRARFVGDRTSLLLNMRSLEGTGPEQIAVMDLTLMHQFTFYAPREFATRVNYVADAGESIRYLNKDTVDRGLMDLRPWFPLKVIAVQSFLAANPHFYVFGQAGDWTWLTFDLPGWGDTKLIRRQDNDRMLFYVDHLRVPLDQSLIEKQRAEESRMLYLREPQTGPSLCDLWMGAEHCVKNMP